MFVFIDESGSFVSAPKRDSWNVIVSYMMPECDWSRVQQALIDLQQTAGTCHPEEIKLKDLNEGNYFDFLNHLGQLHGVLFSVATDAGLNSISQIKKHRSIQAEKIVRYVNRMRYESGRQELRKLSDQVRNLSPQLYIQLRCQVILIETIIRYGVLYFVQRFPNELGKFRWRIDQKNSTKTEYEKAFEILTPTWLQSYSLRKPMIILEEADYSAFKRFEYPKGVAPTYLKTSYGIDIGDSDSLDIGKLIGEDIEFVDSLQSQGVQIADLLAAGLRRTLRAQFNDNQRAAKLLGSLMPQIQLWEMNDSPVRLLGFSENRQEVNETAAKLIYAMTSCSRALLV